MSEQVNVLNSQKIKKDIPKHTTWMSYWKDGKRLYFVTTKDNDRSYYYLYKDNDGKYEKIARSKTPVDFEKYFK